MYQKRCLINIPNLSQVLDEYFNSIMKIIDPSYYGYLVDELLEMSLRFACDTMRYNEPYPIVVDNWSGSISKQSLSGAVYDLLRSLFDEEDDGCMVISNENIHKLSSEMEYYSYIIANKIYACIFLGMSNVDYNNLYSEIDLEYLDWVPYTDCIILYTLGV